MLEPNFQLRISAEGALRHCFFEQDKSVIEDLLKVNDLLVKGHEKNLIGGQEAAQAVIAASEALLDKISHRQPIPVAHANAKTNSSMMGTSNQNLAIA